MSVESTKDATGRLCPKRALLLPLVPEETAQPAARRFVAQPNPLHEVCREAVEVAFEALDFAGPPVGGDADRICVCPDEPGFFGQNFSLLVNHYLNSGWTFWVFGIGTEVVAVIGLLVMFRRRGWLGGPTA